MKLILQNNRVAGTATDEYNGPEDFIAAPPDFDITQIEYYAMVDGALTLVPGTRVTRLAFRNRFTQAEKIAIEIAQLDDPTAAMPVRAQSAALRASQADVQASTFIDLSRADTRTGVQQLEAAGILAAGRALEILDAPVQASEKPV